MEQNSVWRLQTKTSGGNIAEYCLNNKVAALGWSLKDVDQKLREHISSFDEFKIYADKSYKQYSAANRFGTQVGVGDLVWMRSGGKYYLGRFGENSKWKFVASEEATHRDASNQRININWVSYNEADESVIPGAISTAFIKGSTFQRINKSGVFEYSALLYDKLSDTNYYSNIELSLTEKNFYSLLSTDDCEDLLCLWLYKKKGYICIPSTNKIATPLYECILIDPKTGDHIYPQVKKGAANIDASAYSKLNGEVWLLSTEGSVESLPTDKLIFRADPTELYQFALSEESENIISQNIKTWVNLLTEQKIEK